MKFHKEAVEQPQHQTKDARRLLCRSPEKNLLAMCPYNGPHREESGGGARFSEIILSLLFCDIKRKNFISFNQAKHKNSDKWVSMESHKALRITNVAGKIKK